VAPIIAAETPPAPAPPATPSEPTLAGRELAGQACPGCQKRIFLGDEVIQCSRCGVASHLPCWKKHEGCSSEICVPPAAVPDVPEAEVPAGTVPCPVCAEPIPEDANVCPYCAEPIGIGMAPPGAMAATMGVNLPTSFQTAAGQKWSFSIQDDQLIGQSLRGGEQIRLSRHDVSRISISGRSLIITTGQSRQKFKLEDIGLVAVEHWLSGQLRPRTSYLAKEALVNAIIGVVAIFCCYTGVLFGLYSLKRANEAQAEIEMNPGVIQGEGLVTAAKIIGLIDIILGAILLILNFAVPD
jgi:hypothetical protein